MVIDSVLLKWLVLFSLFSIRFCRLVVLKWWIILFMLLKLVLVGSIRRVWIWCVVCSYCSWVVRVWLCGFRLVVLISISL